MAFFDSGAPLILPPVPSHVPPPENENHQTEHPGAHDTNETAFEDQTAKSNTQLRAIDFSPWRPTAPIPQSPRVVRKTATKEEEVVRESDVALYRSATHRSHDGIVRQVPPHREAYPLSRFTTQHTHRSVRLVPVPGPRDLQSSPEDAEDLSDAEVQELGGVEYRALVALSWIVGLYWIGTQFTTFVIITAYLRSTTKYDSVFQSLYRPVPKAWFSAFQSVSAYTGGGMSLVDESMVPFRTSGVMMVFLGGIIVAGNNGLPMFLRLIVWFLSKVVPARQKPTFQFLLAHPRRIIYIVLMYISAYPIAISIRATNVYEQRSLGVYYDVSPEDENAEAPQYKGLKDAVGLSKYIGTHVRKQLQYDVWGLALAWFLISIAERGRLMNSTTAVWYNQFSVLFELVSAYATVGLSLGIPNENYSLSGTFGSLAKVIVCFVMLRGRHRDLPYAIDRAGNYWTQHVSIAFVLTLCALVLLPREFERTKMDASGGHVLSDGTDVPKGNPAQIGSSKEVNHTNKHTEQEKHGKSI
ncbi:low affinity potassium transporter [Tulasnella sp. 332]|nr:low affinity potassium transporter [Tulasnella sp. 332]